jgi:hypothetical protein
VRISEYSEQVAQNILQGVVLCLLGIAITMPFHKQIFVLVSNKPFLRNLINCTLSTNISARFEVLIVVLLKVQVL